MEIRKIIGIIIMITGGVLLLRSYILNRRSSPKKETIARIDERTGYILHLQLVLIGAIIFS